MAKKALIQNFTLYRIFGDVPDKSDLGRSMVDKQFYPCFESSIEPSMGWDAFLFSGGAEAPSEEDYLYADDVMLCCYRQEQKKVPMKYVNDQLVLKVNAHAKEHGKKPSREERRAIKDKIIVEAAKRSFPISTRALVWIDPEAKLLAVGTSSSVLKELVVKSLADMGLGVDLLFADASQNAQIMTQWLYDNNLPINLMFDPRNESNFRSSLDSACQAKLKSEDLTSDEVHKLLEVNDKRAMILPLIWQEQIQFKFEAEGGAISGMKFLDEGDAEGANPSDEEDDAADEDVGYAARVFLFSSHLRDLIDELSTLFPVTEA